MHLFCDLHKFEYRNHLSIVFGVWVNQWAWLGLAIDATSENHSYSSETISKHSRLLVHGFVRPKQMLPLVNVYDGQGHFLHVVARCCCSNTDMRYFNLLVDIACCTVEDNPVHLLI